MRPFFLWSQYGDSLPLAQILQHEGARVTLYVEDEQAKSVGRGLVPTTDKPKVPGGAIVLFDAVKFGAKGAQLRMLGYDVIGGNKLDERLEVDRQAGAKIMLEAGIGIPETHSFETPQDAIDFLNDEDGKWYMKLNGDQGTNMTADAQPDMMIRYLKWWQRQAGEKPSFELQRGVEGTEVSCEGWFDGRKFVLPFNATIEDKKFLAGDRGPRTGCEANIVWALEGKLPLLAADGVAKIAGLLKREKYVGPVDLNCIINAAGELLGLEWSARLGFDASIAYARLFKGAFAEQLEAFAMGALEEWAISDEVAMTLRLSAPPYPTEDAKAIAKKMRGLPLDPTLIHDDRFSLTDVMLDESRDLCLAGRDGQIGTVGTVGTDLAAMRRELVDLADNLRIKALQYRPDPVERAEEACKALEGHGYLGHRALAGYLHKDDDDATDES